MSSQQASPWSVRSAAMNARKTACGTARSDKGKGARERVQTPDDEGGMAEFLAMHSGGRPSERIPATRVRAFQLQTAQARSSQDCQLLRLRCASSGFRHL